VLLKAILPADNFGRSMASCYRRPGLYNWGRKRFSAQANTAPVSRILGVLAGKVIGDAGLVYGPHLSQQ